MSVGSKSQLVGIPFPRRLNSDTPPSLLGPDETPHLRNIMPRTLPTELRPRNGLSATITWRLGNDSGGLGNFKDQAASWIPYHAIFSSDSRYVIIPMVNQTLAASPNWAPYYSGQAVPGATLYSSANVAGHVIVDLVGGTVYGDEYASDTGYNLQAWGQPVYYDNCVLWQQAADPSANTASTKYYHSGQSSYSYQIVGVSNPLAWGGYCASGTFGTWYTRTGSVARENVNLTTTATVSASVSKYLMYPSGTPGSAGHPNPAYRWNYRVRSHTAATSSFVLDRPYGLGETSTNTPDLSACSITLGPYTQVRGAIPGGVTLALFNDRIFSARGTVSTTLTSGTPQTYPTPVKYLGGYYGNAIFWSEPGNFNRWPDQSHYLIGADDEPITGLYTLGNALIVFKANRIYRFTGYDEDSFGYDTVSEVVGCPYPQGMVAYEGTLFFANQEGVWAYDGEKLVSITSPGGSVGISRIWASRPWSRAQGMDKEYFWPTLAVTPDGHLLVVIHYPLATNQYDDHFVYDIKSDSWAEWGTETPTANPIRVVTAPNGKVYGIHRWFISELTDLFNPAVLTPRYDSYPDLSTGAITKASVAPSVEVWFNQSAGMTVRLREMQVDHRVHYTHSDSTPSYTPWAISLGTDPDLVLGASEHSIAARYVNSSGYDSTAPLHYSDRLPETYQREAQTIRVRLTGNTYPDSSERLRDWALFGLKFTVDATRQMGVDNSTT